VEQVTSPIPKRADPSDINLMNRLCSLERESASEGERLAAVLLTEAFEAEGLRAEVEVEQVHGRGFWLSIGLLAGISCASGALGLAGQRRLATLIGGFASVALIDDLDGGTRVWRRFVHRSRESWTVVARAGNPEAQRKLVVLAHHDAPHSGFVFHPKPQRWIWERRPELIENANRSLPFWAPVALGPVAATAGALSGKRWLSKLGIALSAGTVAAMVDIARSPVVPGANDNASGSVGLVMAGRELAAEHPQELDIWLVSCGSEEQMQPGIRAFLKRHAKDLPTDATWFVNLETVGSPELALLEGEGTLWMRDYDAAWTNAVDQAAAESGIEVRRGLRAGASTDSVAVHRKGYRVATLTSITQWKSLSHYHWPSDIPENLDWSTISEAVGVVLAVAKRLNRS